MQSDRALQASAIFFMAAAVAFLVASPADSRQQDCLDCWFDGCTYVSEQCLDCEQYCANCGEGCDVEFETCAVNHAYCVNPDPEGEELKNQACACEEPQPH